MASIGEWIGDKLIVDMTGNSDDVIRINFGKKLKKDIANSVQIIGSSIGGTISGEVGIRVSNLSENDEDYTKDVLDKLGDDVTISANFSETYQTPYAYNTCLVNIEGVSGVNAGRFIIALNID